MASMLHSVGPIGVEKYSWVAHPCKEMLSLAKVFPKTLGTTQVNKHINSRTAFEEEEHESVQLSFSYHHGYDKDISKNGDHVVYQN